MNLSSCLIFCLLAPVQDSQVQCAGNNLTGHWDGAVILRGVSWPLALEFKSSDQELTSFLTIRSLGMVDMPLEIVRGSNGTTTVSLPFGMGDYQLDPVAGLIVVHHQLESGRRITLLLEKDAEYRRPYSTEEFTIHNGDMALSGTLYLPNNSSQPVAGVVIVHGSAPRGRDNWSYRSWADYYARRGMAALVYDKRHHDDTYPDLSDLASDVAAVHAYLQGRPETDAARVGIAGGSQAAWLGTSVAARSESSVAFLIMSGWPSVTPREQELQSLEYRLRDSDLTAEGRRAAIAWYNLYFDTALEKALWGKLDATRETAEASDWGKHVPIPDDPSDLDWWSRNGQFPARELLKRISCPVLACYGDRDSVVPPDRNAEQLRTILAQSGNHDVTVQVFSGADHRIELPMVITAKEVQWPQLAPDYLSLIETWLGDRQFLAE